MTTLLKQITSDLSHWPPDLTEYWLEPEARVKGWPPRPDNNWRYVLRELSSLPTLQSLEWSLDTFELTPEALTAESRDLIVRMFRGYYWRDPSEWTFTDFEGGRERFEVQWKHLAEHSSYPWPPVIQRRQDGFHILDGCHRICATLYLAGWLRARDDDHVPTLASYSLPYWIGHLADR